MASTRWRVEYFGYDGTPADLERIPVETVDRAVEWLAKQPSVDPKRIVVMGSSKGAELALLAAAHNKGISAVIGSAPSSLVYEAISQSKESYSSWTIGGKDVLFAPYVSNDKYKASRRLIDLYDPTYDKSPKEARIPVETILGPILLISGKEDALWPSSKMADEIATRLVTAHFKYKVENLKIDNAGHHAGSYPLRPTADSVRLGGTAEGIAKAQVDAWRAIVAFLKRMG